MNMKSSNQTATFPGSKAIQDLKIIQKVIQSISHLMGQQTFKEMLHPNKKMTLETSTNEILRKVPKPWKTTVTSTNSNSLTR